MSSQSLCLQVCVICLVVCLSLSSQAQDGPRSRVKRGFRIGSASRVAHGYGKRGYETNVGDLGLFTSEQLEPESELRENKEEDWSLLSVDELANLLQAHPKLARSIIKKLLDTNNDGMISADELFRPTRC